MSSAPEGARADAYRVPGSTGGYDPTVHFDTDDPDELAAEVKYLREEVDLLRRRLEEAPTRIRALEERLLEARGRAQAMRGQNRRLEETLRAARDQLAALREEIDRLSAPPHAYATYLGATHDAQTATVMVSGRKLEVSFSADVGADGFELGQEVLLNEGMNIVGAGRFLDRGELMIVSEVLDDGRIVVAGHSDDERIVQPALPLLDVAIRSGDTLLVDLRSGSALERIEKPELQQLTLEEVPDVTYDQIGGLRDQVEAIRDAVELPYLYGDLFLEHELRPPKGILLYGPPGCGKTMIAKAVANALAQRVRDRTGRDDVRSWFINVKGPELLNKYVGETERQIRLIFQRAREKSAEGCPVIVFFDEMESLFRTRGSGVSSDVETTIVPQLLAEIDGVENLRDVVVIGASNREDMIDPAILRPGRLDVKIKVDRPDEDASREIFAIYLHARLPLHADDLAAHDGDPTATVAAMIDQTVEKMYASDRENEFLEVTYASGEKETLYFRDFNSGAMIESVVARAKKFAIKRRITDDEYGLRTDDLLRAIHDEFRENEDLPNTTNPDDWARISGKKGERIVYVRTLVGGPDASGRAIENVSAGQYL
ncbi:MAG: proteasome ATPase [Nitriliruptoraceae bacterium]